MNTLAIHAQGLCYKYGERLALSNLNLKVSTGNLYGLVGPNGGGKSTTFKILATLLTPLEGTAHIFEWDVLKQRNLIRKNIGVVFQSPAVDNKLTVYENLIFQTRFFGLSGNKAKERVQFLLNQVGLSDRKKEIVEKLSGGLKRRVEVAKALIHEPKLLLLDEPFVGLDPLIRRQIWESLTSIQKNTGMTVLLTTHLMDEAERCHRIALVDQGKVVVEGVPEELKSELGSEIIMIDSKKSEELSTLLTKEMGLQVEKFADQLQVRKNNARELVNPIMKSYDKWIDSIRLGRPTLEDVFLKYAGHHYHGAQG